MATVDSFFIGEVLSISSFLEFHVRVLKIPVDCFFWKINIFSFEFTFKNVEINKHKQNNSYHSSKFIPVQVVDRITTFTTTLSFVASAPSHFKSKFNFT